MLDTISLADLSHITGGQSAAPQPPPADAARPVTNADFERATRDFIRQQCGPTGNNCHVSGGSLVKGLP